MKGKKTGMSKRTTVAARQRGQEAIRLRMAGATIAQIADQLGFANESGAYKSIVRELERTAKDMGESTEAVRQLSLKRLDQMLFTVWSDVLTGDGSAISTALRIEERRSSLMGLDAPRQIEAKVRVDVMSWNEAIKDFLDLYREYHKDAPEAPMLIQRLDELSSQRFAGVEMS
jgi:hypothetical protein|tara:strand:- start:35 stop:553 length:519 start_codon:yes stop_codon:yes gene_type:complete